MLVVLLNDTVVICCISSFQDVVGSFTVEEPEEIRGGGITAQIPEERLRRQRLRALRGLQSPRERLAGRALHRLLQEPHGWTGMTETIIGVLQCYVLQNITSATTFNSTSPFPVVQL